LETKAKANCYTCKLRYLVENQDYCNKFKAGIPQEVLDSNDLDCDMYIPYAQDRRSDDNEK